jgi:hypothetical protein
MKSLYVEDITYVLPSNVSKFTLPTALVFNVDDNFNKYTETAKLIKETVGYDPVHYTFTETLNTTIYPSTTDMGSEHVHA